MLLFRIKKAIITDKLNYHNLKIDQHNVKEIIIINHFIQNLTLQIFLKSIHFIALIVESVVLDQKFHQMCPPLTLSLDYLILNSPINLFDQKLLTSLLEHDAQKLIFLKIVRFSDDFRWIKSASHPFRLESSAGCSRSGFWTLQVLEE